MILCILLQGWISSVPERYPDVVPIQISCPEVITYGETKDDGLEEMRHIWRKAVREADAAKKNLPDSTKYQKNFHVLVYEVLNSLPYLFTHNEKLFIGIHLIT